MDIVTILIYIALTAGSVVCMFILYVRKYFEYCYNYWYVRNIPCVRPKDMITNVRDFILLKSSFTDTLDELYNHLDGHKLGGIFELNRPSLMLRDPDVIRQVTVTHFHHFHERGYHTDEISEPLSCNLYTLRGSKWHRLRTETNGPFQYEKVKSNFQDIKEISICLRDSVSEYCERRETIRFDEICGRYATDAIGLYAFGLRLGAMNDVNSVLYKIGRAVFGPSYVNSVRRLVGVLIPRIRKVLRFTRNYRIEQVFISLIKATIDHRKKRHAYRDDFLQLLIRMRNSNKKSDKNMKLQDLLKQINSDGCEDDRIYMSHNLIASQCFGSFLFGMEPPALTISFAIYELAANVRIQETLWEEIDTVLQTSERREIIFDSLQKMKYLNQIVCETLRKYPPMPFMERLCTKSCSIIGTDCIIEKDTRVLVPIYALHHDQKYYPKPEKFDPERFNEENKRNRHPSTYLPFGEGPRNCVGSEYSLTVIKTAIAILIANFRFSLCPETPYPIKLHPRTFLLAPMDGIWLTVENR